MSDITEADLRRIIESAGSWRQVAENLGYAPSGNLVKRLRELADKYEIDYGHFSRRGRRPVLQTFEVDIPAQDLIVRIADAENGSLNLRDAIECAVKDALAGRHACGILQSIDQDCIKALAVFTRPDGSVRARVGVDDDVAAVAMKLMYGASDNAAALNFRAFPPSGTWARR